MSDCQVVTIKPKKGAAYRRKLCFGVRTIPAHKQRVIISNTAPGGGGGRKKSRKKSHKRKSHKRK